MDYGDILFNQLNDEQDARDAMIYAIESMSDDEFDFVYDEVSFVYECAKTGVIIDADDVDDVADLADMAIKQLIADL